VNKATCRIYCEVDARAKPLSEHPWRQFLPYIFGNLFAVHFGRVLGGDQYVRDGNRYTVLVND
jgi:hypothetical protein